MQSAIEHIFPLVYEFRKKRTPAEKIELLKPPEFDPEALIEEECDITDATSAASFVDGGATRGGLGVGGEVGDDEDCFDGSTGTDTKAINHHARRSNRKCASRYSSTRVGRRRPAGKADNDPTEDAMYVSDDDDDDEDDDMIESD